MRLLKVWCPASVSKWNMTRSIPIAVDPINQAECYEFEPSDKIVLRTATLVFFMQ